MVIFIYAKLSLPCQLPAYMPCICYCLTTTPQLRCCFRVYSIIIAWHLVIVFLDSYKTMMATPKNGIAWNMVSRQWQMR